VAQALTFFIRDMGGPISSIIADGERAFLSNQVLEELHQRDIEMNFIKADYLNHIRMVDNIIKTLRNRFNRDVSRMIDPEEMQKAIKYLNNSINRNTQLTHTEMENYPQLEEIWIRRVRANNNAVKEIQEESGLFNYKLGDKLFICLDKHNTKN
jgi:polyhydroxyalkanoate synthesis regulator protein